MTQKESLFDLLIHDLTGPLSIVSTSAAKLLERGGRHGSLTDPQRRSLERIFRNAQKARRLLHEMVEISHSEEGIFRKESFGVEKVVRESILDVIEMTNLPVCEKLRQAVSREEFLTLLESHGVFVKITGKYRQAAFSHDPMKIQQILRNLISNALKYCRGRVEVSLSGETDLTIQVKDDGLGIPQENQKVVFDRFVQLHNAEVPDPQGFGLGLTGVKALVEAMAGEISLASSEGGGTCFTVRIPSL